MRTEEQLSAASDRLFELWQTGGLIESLPREMKPADRREGYAIQAQLEGRSDQPLFGWKIAATSEAGQKHINVSAPLVGRLLADRVVPDGGECRFGVNHMAVSEAEFAFRMGSDIPPRDKPYTTPEVLAAVESLHPAIEIPDSRFVDFTKVGEAQLIADNACAHEFVLGEAVAVDWRSIDLASHEVRLTVENENGILRVAEGIGRNVLGSPVIALTWIANELSAIGKSLRARQVVTTGTCVTPPPISAGDRLLADFGSLGLVSVQLTP